MNPSRIPPKAELESLIRAGKSSTKIATQYGVTRRTVDSWRRIHKVTISARDCRKPDYTEADRLILAGELDSVISAKTGISKSQVVRRRVNHHHICRKPNQAIDAVPYEPCIPPADRPRMNAEATRKRLGMDRRTFEEVWLPAHIWTADRGFVEVGRCCA